MGYHPKQQVKFSISKPSIYSCHNCTNCSLRDARCQQAVTVIIVISKLPERYTDNKTMYKIVNTLP